MVADGNWTYCGAYPIMHKNIKSVYCIPKTNRTMSVKYNLAKKNAKGLNKGPRPRRLKQESGKGGRRHEGSAKRGGMVPLRLLALGTPTPRALPCHC